MPRKLKAVQIFWKLRTWRLGQVNGPFENPADYLADVDQVLAGIQNEALVNGPVQDPASEDICVFVRAVSNAGYTRQLSWRDLLATAALKDAGGVDDSEENWSLEWDAVSYPGGAFPQNPFKVGTIFRIEDEICTITSLTPGAGQAFTVTVRRGDHGTDAVAHAQDTPLRAIKPSIPMRIHTLSEVLSGVPAPSNLVAQAKPQTIYLTWDQNLDATQLAKLKETVLYWSTATPVTTADSSIIIRGKKAEYTFYAPDDQTYYFAVLQRPHTGPDSALSNEANAARSIVSVEDPTKPAPPVLGAQGVGGGPGQGWLIRVSAQMTAADIAAGLGGEMIQVQIAGPGYTFEPDSSQPTSGFLTGLVNRLDGSQADQQIDGRRIDVTWSFTLSSEQLGGPYSASARIYNRAGSVWSDWQTPVDVLTQAGVPDSDPPSDPTDGLFTILDAPGAAPGVGNAIQARVRIPSSNQLSIWGFELQATDDLGNWDETPADALGGTIVRGGSGDIVTGQLTMTNVTPSMTAHAHAGQPVTFYDQLISSGGKYTGEIRGRWFSNLIDDNDTDTLTIKPGNPAAWPETKNGKTFTILSSWDFYKHRKNYQLQQLRSDGLMLGAGEYVTPPVAISEDCYFRIRWHNKAGVGRWIYYKSGTPEGTTDQTQASQFSPSKLQSLAIGVDQVMGIHIAPGEVDNTHIAAQAVEALQLASELKPPTLGTGDPSGAPGATEGPWYYRTDAPAGDSPYWYWNGSSWSNDPDTFPDQPMAAAGIVAGYVAAAAIRTSAAIVDGILDANHIVAGGMTMLAGQDFTFITSDTDPTELIFGPHHKIAADVTGGVSGVGGTATLNIYPQADNAKDLYLGWPLMRWQHITMHGRTVDIRSHQDGGTAEDIINYGYLLTGPAGAQIGTRQGPISSDTYSYMEVTENQLALVLSDVTAGVFTLSGGSILADLVGDVIVEGDAQFDGYVGIGTANPDNPLEVVGSAKISGTAPRLDLEDTDISGVHRISAANVQFVIHADPSNVDAGSNIGFYIDGSEKVRINSAGQFGIGTASPSTPLDVQGGTAVSQITAASSVAGNMWGLITENKSSDASAVGILSFKHTPTTGSGADAVCLIGGKEQQWTSTASTKDGYFSVHIRENNSISEKFRISSAGNVTITGGLDVTGAITGSIDGAVLDDNSLAALQLASELKPPTVASGAPSGAPGANEGPWYHRTDTDPPTLYYWNGSSWSADPDTWPDGAIAAAGMIAGYLSVGAVRASAMIVDDVILADHIAANQIDAGHISASGLTLTAGQDIVFEHSDTDPTELIFESTATLIAEVTNTAMYWVPLSDGSGRVYIGGDASITKSARRWSEAHIEVAGSASSFLRLKGSDTVTAGKFAEVSVLHQNSQVLIETAASSGGHELNLSIKADPTGTGSGVPSLTLYDESGNWFFANPDKADFYLPINALGGQVQVRSNETANYVYLNIGTTSTDLTLNFNDAGTATLDLVRLQYGGSDFFVHDGTAMTFKNDPVTFEQDVTAELDLSVGADLKLALSGTEKARVYMFEAGTTDALLISGLTTIDFAITTNIRNMSFQPSGGVIIGTPTGSYKGAGTLNANAVYDDGTLLTDFVFEEEYPLLPIDKMRAFYQEHKHLPTIIGRQEWEEKGGISLGKLSSQIWETVECQAIYIAQLEERIRMLEQEVRERC